MTELHEGFHTRFSYFRPLTWARDHGDSNGSDESDDNTGGTNAVSQVELNLTATVPIERTEDIVRARQTGRLLVQRLGFSENQSTIVATAISELARNIILYAKSGEITVTAKQNRKRYGVVVEAMDAGPGIVNVQHAIKSGFSTSGGLGLGLSGVREMAHEFSIRSHAGLGTMVAVTIWRE